MNKTAVVKTENRRAVPPRLDKRFVLWVMLPLAAAAVVVNVPPVHALGWPRHLLNCLIWLTTLAVLLHDPQLRGEPRDNAADRPGRSAPGGVLRRLRPRKALTVLVSLGLVALFSLLSFYDFGRFHANGRFVHYHDSYHYYMGSKYFPEVGYEGLYAATHRALIENDPALADAISLVKNLRTYDVESARISLQRSEAVASLFSVQRWEQFKHDVRFFQAEIPPAQWQVLLVDHGFNATPFWTGLGSAFSGRLPLSHTSLLLLALLDPLLLGLALLLVWRTFDAKTCLLVAIFLFANFFGVFDITGGAFLRQLWLAALIGCVCLFQRGQMILAAALLAVAVLDRVFPIVFLLPPAMMFISNVLRGRPERRAQVRFFVACAGFAAGLGLLAFATTGGPRIWSEWYSKISAHSRWFYTNQLSLRNLFTVNPVQSVRTISGGWDEGQWLRERQTFDAATRHTLLAARIALVALLVAAVAKREDWMASAALVSFAPLVLFYPADYYCVFLAIAILCWRGNRALALTLVGLQGFFWLINIPLSSGLRIELLHWIVSLSLVLTFVVFLAREMLDNSRSVMPARSRLSGALVVAVAVILGVGILADARAASQERLPVELDLTARDVSTARGMAPRPEQMAMWGNAWSRNDHLLFPADAPGAQAVVRVTAPHAGAYSVAVTYSTGQPFGVVTLAVNGRSCDDVNLYAPRQGVRRVVYGEFELRGGDNEFSFVVAGKDPAALHHYFAIDTVTLDQPPPAHSGEPARRTALERAIAWLLAHPADCFDGGRPGICGEIAALYSLAANPQLSTAHSDYIAELEHRAAHLDTCCGPRVRPEEYEGLLVAGYMSRQLKLPFAALDALSPQLKSWVDALYSDRSAAQLLPAGEYFNRLYPAQAVSLSLNQSVLQREYSERKLAQILAGQVDRTKARAVAMTVFAFSQDVSALTDFGNLPPPPGFLADQQFWAKLCDDGLRWSMQTGDLLTLARLVHMAECLRVAAAVPALPTALDFLVRQQQPDGSFGALTCDSPNPFRDGVLSAIQALASSLH